MEISFFTRFFGGAAGFLTRSVSIVSDVISDPRADLTQTILVMGILTVIVLICVLLSLTTYFIISNRSGPKRRIILTTKEPTIYGTSITWIVFLLLAIGLYWSVETYSAKPSTCAYCHTDQKQERTLSKSSHKGTSCMACHQTPGVVGFFVSKLDYVRWIIRSPQSDKRKHQADVANQSCLRCHRDTERRTASHRGIRVRHLDITQAGYKCIDCHNTTAHGNEVASPKRPTMEKCVLCHNEKVASANCEVCHVASSKQADVASSQRLFDREFLPTRLALPKNCRGCHNVKTECNVCHGLEMPHTKDFMEKGKHAREGFLVKDICWRCHRTEYKFCNRGCHDFPSPHGPSDRWRKVHGPASRDPDFATLSPHDDSPLKGCGACHSLIICRLCHDDDRKAVK